MTPQRRELDNRVRELRLERGLSQHELAARTGLTRQSISAIENRRYIPSTAVALRLSSVLGGRVEDLFALPEPDVDCLVEVVGSPDVGSRRVALGHVRGRMVAHPLAAGSAVQEGFASADGVLPQQGHAGYARLLTPRDQIDRTAVLMGCDPSLGILSAHLARHSGDTRLIWLPAPSRAALRALLDGEVHVAGSHLLDPAGEDFNVAGAREALASTGGLVVTFASWEQGFIVPYGNPRELRTVNDLVEKRVRMVNREVGAGCREFLDMLLRLEGIAPEAIRGYDKVVGGHLDVARAVASGAADTGVAPRAVAHVFGLGFVPLSQVRFDLVIPRDFLDLRSVYLVMDILQSQALRTEIGAIPGYDVTQMGKVVAEVPAAA